MKELKELKYISTQNSKILKKVRDRVHSIIPGAEIILYGSRARAKAGLESDWDFLILLDRKPDQQVVGEIRDQLYELELQNNIILSSIIRSRHEWNSDLYSILPFKKEVERDGVLI